MEERLVVPHDDANGRWELRSSKRRDELGDMGPLEPMW
jgi:hypothetical protein